MGLPHATHPSLLETSVTSTDPVQLVSKEAKDPGGVSGQGTVK